MEEFLRAQAGTVSRRQLVDAGARPHDIERMLRRRTLVRLLPGVYVDHTGEPTWLQRAWAGLLHHGPAALDRSAALHAELGPAWRHFDPRAPIDLAIDHGRRTVPAPGYRVRRVHHLSDRVHPSASPPRVRVEQAVLDVALSHRHEIDRIGVLADVCQSRRTTATRIETALRHRTRSPDRSWLTGVLTDIAQGTCSTLEHGYLHRVEGPHGLPRASRQRPSRAGSRLSLRDVDYDPLPVLVELDGRLFHDTADQRDRDLDRDLDAAVDGRQTVRLGWGQVFGRPCRTAERLAALLIRAGWPGAATACGPQCSLRSGMP